ncbi:MAG: ATP-binding cassette domain-containing protein [Rhodopseudomonas sp.]|nr:ATP-binding cassette domain-containing protein [Rhodopseudomonas sp.]
MVPSEQSRAVANPEEEKANRYCDDSSSGLAVRCRNISKTYGAGVAKVAALRGVDLDVRHGELLMLVGPSGCGKTSLISIIATILDQDEGTCEVLGRDLANLGPLERARLRSQSLGFVFQVFNLLPALTAIENVSVPLLIKGIGRKQAETRAIELLDMVGLAERRRNRPPELSGGQQQRVAIARALACDPQLVICDEPTSSLDHESGHSVMEILKLQAKSPERAVIVVTHDQRNFPYADRLARMDDGRVVSIHAGDARNAP